MKQAFNLDFYRMSGFSWTPSLRAIAFFISHHNVRFMYWWRIRSSRNTILSSLAYYRLSRKYGLEFSSCAKIGAGLYIGHPYNISIGDYVVIGSNVNIHKGATIGVENRGPRCGSPTIGNQVFIGINATIVGRIRIGDDVLVAPGAYINFDVPSHSIVVGNPGRIIPKNNATAGYIQNHIEIS